MAQRRDARLVARRAEKTEPPPINPASVRAPIDAPQARLATFATAAVCCESVSQSNASGFASFSLGSELGAELFDAWRGDGEGFDAGRCGWCVCRGLSSVLNVAGAKSRKSGLAVRAQQTESSVRLLSSTAPPLRTGGARG